MDKQQLFKNIQLQFDEQTATKLDRYFKFHQFDSYKEMYHDIYNGFDNCCCKMILFKHLNATNVFHQHKIYEKLKRCIDVECIMGDQHEFTKLDRQAQIVYQAYPTCYGIEMIQKQLELLMLNINTCSKTKETTNPHSCQHLFQHTNNPWSATSPSILHQINITPNSKHPLMDLWNDSIKHWYPMLQNIHRYLIQTRYLQNQPISHLFVAESKIFILHEAMKRMQQCINNFSTRYEECKCVEQSYTSFLVQIMHQCVIYCNEIQKYIVSNESDQIQKTILQSIERQIKNAQLILTESVINNIHIRNCLEQDPYIKEPNENIDFITNISQFPNHMTVKEANKIEIRDKIDHRDSVGRFVSATVIDKFGPNLQIHYNGWSAKFDVWSHFHKEPFRFAHENSISKRPAHRFKHLKVGDSVHINPTQIHPGWKCGKVTTFDTKSGQIQVVYKFLHQKCLYWAHLDNTNEIDECIDTVTKNKKKKHFKKTGKKK
eukprot:202075_1